MIKVIKDFFKGAAFGATGIVPALSGGTVAMILGFYGELIESLSHFNQNRRKYTKFLLPLGLGVLAGLVLFSSAVYYLLVNYSFPTMTFFIGLIVGIIPLIYVKGLSKNSVPTPPDGRTTAVMPPGGACTPIFRDALKMHEPGRHLSFREAALVLVPMFILIIVSGMRPASAVNPAEAVCKVGTAYMFFIFFVGIVTGAAMVLPGISGAYIQLLFGVYPLVTYALSSIGPLLAGGAAGVPALHDIAKVLGPLVAGMLAGGFFMARAIEKLLKSYFRAIHSIILGLLLGSVYALFRDPMTYQSGLSVSVVVIGAAVFLLGCVISYYLGDEKKSKGAVA